MEVPPPAPAPRPPGFGSRAHSAFVRGWHRLHRSQSNGGPRSWVSVSQTLVRSALLAIPIGVVAGLGSAAFYFLWLESTRFFLEGIVGIGYPYAGAPPNGVVVWSSSFPRILLLPLVMAGGGLATGWIVARWAPEVAGHGTDAAIQSFHEQGGRVRRRVAFLKTIASALTLGTGGAGGREGPSGQIGGAFGSWWADSLGLSDRERRIALATGLGAGVGAIFRAPLGGAIYSAEILYIQDFEPDVFFPAIVASVISYSIFGVLFGFSTLFALPAGGVSWNVEQIPLYALLGLVCAAAGVGFIRFFRSTEDRFRAIRGGPLLRIPLGMAIAGVAVLAVYFLLPWGNHFAALASIDVGYGFVQAAMLGQIGVVTLVPLALIALSVAIVLRAATTSLTVGSGGAAGLFGTSVVIGALVGVEIGAAFHTLLPSVVSAGEISAFAIVGMMTFFGGVSKAPLAVLVMVAEMTGSYDLLVPAMLAIFIAYIGTGPYHLYEEQRATRLDSPAHRDEYVALLRGEQSP
ncbi:MAG TPA: chloride channel protein [Thermoplasmata archaeon]|nr:chloride channel protein [Thermoplasmata archaeon]